MMNGDYSKVDSPGAALSRALSGDMTGHEDCGPDGCDVVDSFKEEPYPGAPFRNFMVTRLGLSPEEAMGFHYALCVVDVDPSLMARVFTVISHEIGAAASSLHVDQSRTMMQDALDEHYPTEVTE